MKRGVKRVALALMVIPALMLAACAHPKPIPGQAMEFEPGMKAVANNLAEQLEKSSIGNMLNKVVVNPLTKQGSLKKLVIDPFIDTESGYPVKLNNRICSIMSDEMTKRFAVTGAMEPDNLQVSEYVVTGMVSLEPGQGNVHKVNAAVFEKSSGVVHASAEARVTGFDTTPMHLYEDSPVFLKGQNYEQHVASARKKPNETVEKGYQEKLEAKSMRVKGDTLYEERKYDESLKYYNKAADKGEGIEILNGVFTNLVHQGRYREAGEAYGKLLRASVEESNEVSSKITFGPNSKAPLAAKAPVYNIFIKEIASLVASKHTCKVKIIGHCSRTGSEGYNNKLSLQRAVAIQKQMASYAPGILARTAAIGRGFQDNIVGTGRDDLTDEIDRRVEFKFDSCGN